ncbi:hypothetical protein MA9V2_248 [Chryseobacterium phage MA9V-2]|nr:hypothetical protein MA9V2_248 [Chryseobacterium phage MA9V-2]
MKNIFFSMMLGLFALTSCNNKNASNVKHEADSLTLIDTAFIVVDSVTKDSVPIYIEQEAYDNKAQIAKEEFNRLKKSADSLYNITLSLKHLEGQYATIIATGKADYKSLDTKKITLAQYKAKLKANLERKIVKKSFDDEVIASPIFTEADSAKDKFIVYLGVIEKIETEIIPTLKEQELEISRSTLHKKLVVANAQYYLNITLRNPSQDKFLKGWTRRAWSQ